MSKDIIILQHIDIETPGYILDLMKKDKFKTEQELFWRGDFGDKYIKRNIKSNRELTIGKNLLSNNVKIHSAIELGANIGLNLDAIKKILIKK